MFLDTCEWERGCCVLVECWHLPRPKRCITDVTIEALRTTHGHKKRSRAKIVWFIFDLRRRLLAWRLKKGKYETANYTLSRMHGVALRLINSLNRFLFSKEMHKHEIKCMARAKMRWRRLRKISREDLNFSSCFLFSYALNYALWLVWFEGLNLSSWRGSSQVFGRGIPRVPSANPPALPSTWILHIHTEKNQQPALKGNSNCAKYCSLPSRSSFFWMKWHEQRTNVTAVEEINNYWWRDAFRRVSELPKKIKNPSNARCIIKASKKKTRTRNDSARMRTTRSEVEFIARFTLPLLAGLEKRRESKKEEKAKQWMILMVHVSFGWERSECEGRAAQRK